MRRSAAPAGGRVGFCLSVQHSIVSDPVGDDAEADGESATHRLIPQARGYSVTETTDENPERVALVQQITTAYLRSALGLGDDGWSQARTDLQGDPHASGRLESK